MKKIFYIFALVIITFTSCDKNEVTIQPEASVSINEHSENNQLLSEYARILAASLNNTEIKQTLKDEALKKFDGDYDILVNKLENIQLGKSTNSFKSILAKNAKSTSGIYKSKSNTSANIDSFFNKIKETFPNLQVSIPIHCENWDTEKYTPMVAFIPVDYDEKTFTEVTAFDTNGNEFKISTKFEPSLPVVVVSISERVDIDGNLISDLPSVTSEVPRNKVAPNTPTSITLKHGQSKSLIIEWGDVLDENGYEVWRMSDGNVFTKISTNPTNENTFIDTNLNPNVKYWYKVRAINSDGSSAWSPIIATTASERNDGETLRMHSMKFTTSALQAVEDWVSGRPEMRLRVIRGSETGASFVFTSGQLRPAWRNDIRNNWWHCEFDICDWNTNVFGTVLTFDWREEDLKYQYEFNVSGSYEDKRDNGTIKSGGTINIKNDPSPDNIGNTTVFWWHPRNKIYDITGFSWYFAQ